MTLVSLLCPTQPPFLFFCPTDLITICAPTGMVEIETGAFKGHKWAQPSVAHLQSLLRRVRTEPEEAAEKGRAARRDMVEQYCPACVTRIVLDTIKQTPPRGVASKSEL